LEDCNPTNVDKIRYDPNMNLGKVVRENAFGFLKNKWKFLKHFNYKVDKTSLIIVVCCVFHNYCEILNALEFGLTNARIRGDSIMGFSVDKLPVIREGKQAKTQGERLRKVLFGQWVIDHPIVP